MVAEAGGIAIVKRGAAAKKSAAASAGAAFRVPSRRHRV